MSSRAERGRDIVRRTFGVALYQQGRGFYPALEFLAIARGSLLLERAEREAGTPAVRVLPPTGDTFYLKNGHDHARRLLSRDATAEPGVFVDEPAREVVRALLQGLEAPVPGRRAGNHSLRERHFYPYPPQAIHHDAYERHGTMKSERAAYRGAGGLAHKILRTDPDTARLDASRDALRGLLSGDGGALGKLLDTLGRHDALGDVAGKGPDDAFEDAVEARTLGGDDPGADADGPGARPTRWMEMLREGVHRLLTREELSPFERIDDLMHWIPWCIACHVLAMARRRAGRDENAPLVFDAGHGKSRVREAARRHLGESSATIRDALLIAARESGVPELASGSSGWWTPSRTFYATTLFAVGALNANTGVRHYELGAPLLQAMVHALVDRPIAFDTFAREILGLCLGIVCEPASASLHGRLGLDGLDLERNGEHLVERLDEVGLSRSLSDATRMIGIHE